MADRKAFLLRIDPAVLDALQAWADDELRSLNGQIEFVLRRVLQDEGRLKGRLPPGAPDAGRPRPAPSASSRRGDTLVGHESRRSSPLHGSRTGM